MSGEIKTHSVKSPLADRYQHASPCITSKENQIDSKRLESLLRQLPEVKNLIELSERHLSYFHQDETLPQYAQFFGTVIENNRSIFSNLSSQGKAEILFQCYTELAFAHLQQTHAFKKQYEKVLTETQPIRGEAALKQHILESFCKEKSRRNDTFIRFAIGQCLKADPLQLHLRDIGIYDQLSPLITRTKNLFNSFNSGLYSSHMGEEGLIPE